MTATSLKPTAGRLSTVTGDIRRGLQGVDLIGPTLPIAAIVGMYIWLGTLNSNAFSYVGLDLILGSAVPLAFAAVSQSFIITLGDIDLGIGFYVGLTNAIVAIILTDNPMVGVLCLIGVVVVYALQGALISARGLHSITFTLGSSFVWLGVARYIAPTPKASAPGWLGTFFSFRPPLFPLPVWLILAAAAGGYLIMFRSRAGLLVRSAGSNEEAFVANGGSIIKARAYGYGFAGLFGVLSGVTLTGVTRSADVTASADYTLLSIAAVIVGGAAFTGGKISMFGAVAGAVVFSMISALMTQLNIQSSLQVGARGLALVLVIAARLVLTNRSRG